MEFQANEYARLLKAESISNQCMQEDPHCPRALGDLCSKGCFEVTVDLQTMTVVSEE